MHFYKDFGSSKRLKGYLLHSTHIAYRNTNLPLCSPSLGCPLCSGIATHSGLGAWLLVNLLTLSFLSMYSNSEVGPRGILRASYFNKSLVVLHVFFSSLLTITVQTATVIARLPTVPTHIAILFCHIVDAYKNLCWPEENWSNWCLAAGISCMASGMWQCGKRPGTCFAAMNSSYTPIISRRPSCLVQDLYERVGKGHKEMRWPRGRVWGQGAGSGP